MKKHLSRLVVCMLVVSLAVPGSAVAFSDVSDDASYYMAVTYLQEKGLVKGYEDGTFKPNQGVNRAEALAMILKAFGHTVEQSSPEDIPERTISPTTPLMITLPEGTALTLKDPVTGEVTTVKNIQTLELQTDEGAATLKMSTPKVEDKPFEDVSQEDWFFNTVVTGKIMGIVKGENNGKLFNPSAPVNLAQALRMMYQSSETDTSKVNFDAALLPDTVPSDSWYAKDMAYSALNGILMQREDGSTFPPEKNLTRGELALLLYRLIGTKNNKIYGYASWYGDGLSVIRPKENVEYVDKHLTAAHKTLPHGSIVRVWNMWNGKHVDVVINDWGPYVTGRVIDLSKSAFNAIGDSGDGIMAIQMEVIMVASQ